MTEEIETVEVRQAAPNKANFRVLYYSLALCCVVAVVGLLVLSV